LERGPLEYLFSLEQFGIKFGLENIRALLDAFGHPERTFHALHVAGTNGKGSVTAMADAMLGAAGYRTGRYTSPHLVDVTERFTVDGLPVSRATLELAAADLRQAIDALRLAGTLAAPPTFFEATTALALEMFRRAHVEVAVCEVGLGGRLDATNVLQPVATAITSIGFDHQQYLGTTLEAIAREKAGIIKPGVPVVVGRMAAEARAAILETAGSLGAPVIDATDTSALQDRERPGRVRLSTPLRDYGTVEVALAGAHQIENARVAVRLAEAAASRGLEVPAEAIVRGLETVSWPGRLEHRRLRDGRQILLDASHNPQGAEALAAYLRASSWNRTPLVFAAMKDKDIHQMLTALVPAVGALVLTRASNPRSIEPAELAASARALDPRLRITTAAHPPAALATAWSLSSRIVAAGSIFLLGDVMKEIDGA
jgi:dihydrofolate synthase/folylpolyglutamate synthase